MRVQRRFVSALRRGVGGDHGSDAGIAARGDGSFEDIDLGARPLAPTDASAGSRGARRCVRVRRDLTGGLSAARHGDPMTSANSAALKNFGLSLSETRG